METFNRQFLLDSFAVDLTSMAEFKPGLPVVYEDDSSVSEYFTNALTGDLQLLFGMLLLMLSIALAPFVTIFAPVIIIVIAITVAYALLLWGGV